MKFSLSDPNPATRFTFQDGSGYVELRAMTPAVMDKLHKKHTTVKAEYHRGVRHEVSKTDHDAYDADFWDHCIAGWDGLTDENDQPIPCTKENKLVLYKNSPEFSSMIRVLIDKLAEDLAARTEALEKNFSTTSQDS